MGLTAKDLASIQPGATVELASNYGTTYRAEVVRVTVRATEGSGRPYVLGHLKLESGNLVNFDAGLGDNHLRVVHAKAWTCSKCGAMWTTRPEGDCYQCDARAGAR